MSQHFPCYSAVFPLLLREHNGKREVLLHRRHNTGYMDGKWDIAGSGHVDEDETARQALARECTEELGIRVPEALRIVPAGTPGSLAAKVRTATYMGAHAEYNLETSAGRLFVISPDPQVLHEAGAPIGLATAGHGIFVVRP